MLRCSSNKVVRIFLCLLLSLLVIASFFSFCVFADDNDNVTQGNLSLTFSYGSGDVSIPVFENSHIVFKTNPSANENFTFYLKSISWNKYANEIPSNTFISFKVSFFEACNTHSSHYSVINHFSTVNSQLGNLYYINDSSYYPNFYSNLSDYSIRPYISVLNEHVFVKAQFTKNTGLSFLSSATFRQYSGTSSNSSYLYIVLHDVQILPNVSWFFSEMLSFQQSILTQMLNLVDYTFTFLERLTVLSDFTVSADYYDDNNDFNLGEEVNTNWYTAIYQLLSNLYAPVREQSMQEQKAKDSGALDALDNAFDSVGSSFGSLSDFGSIDSIATWNFRSFSDSASQGIFSWFSQATKDDIDTVPRTRYQNIVDFYSSHIQEIEELMP